MKISEIFYSLQGEGIDSGKPSIFIRTQGCQLHCSWCDTKYSWGEGGKDLGIEGVLREVSKFPCGNIYITGGEPLVQEEELLKLLPYLRDKCYNIRIATNGVIFPELWKYREVSWDVDIKCPSSGEAGKSKNDWFDVDNGSVEVKFVVQDWTDLSFAKIALQDHIESDVGKWVSPVMDGVNIDKEFLNDVAVFCIENNCRMSLQLQKIIWGNKKGV